MEKRTLGLVLLVIAVSLAASNLMLAVHASDCDLNNDGKVDITDIGLAAIAFGSYPGHSRWDPEADLNQDSKVDIRDIALIAMQFGSDSKSY